MKVDLPNLAVMSQTK